MCVPQGGKGATAALSVWLLLSRHVVTKEREEDSGSHDARGGGGGRGLAATVGEGQDYLTVHVFDDKGGRRVFSPGKPMLQGVYSPNPQTLVRFDVPLGPARQRQAFTVVASQYKKSRAVDFTLQALATEGPVALAPAPPLPRHVAEIRGVWDGRSSGGPLGGPRFFANPMWSVAVAQPSRLHVELVAPRELFVGLRLIRGANGQRVDTYAPPGATPAASVGSHAVLIPPEKREPNVLRARVMAPAKFHACVAVYRGTVSSHTFPRCKIPLPASN
jgi:hypothetical protein